MKKLIIGIIIFIIFLGIGFKTNSECCNDEFISFYSIKLYNNKTTGINCEMVCRDENILEFIF